MGITKQINFHEKLTIVILASPKAYLATRFQYQSLLYLTESILHTFSHFNICTNHH